MSRAVESILIPAVESISTLSPEIRAPAAMVMLGVVSVVSTPARTVWACESLVTRRSTPFPLPGTVASPKRRLSARPPARAIAPTCRTSAPFARATLVFAARMISGANSGVPALSTVMLFVRTWTVVPAVPKVAHSTNEQTLRVKLVQALGIEHDLGVGSPGIRTADEDIRLRGRDIDVGAVIPRQALTQHVAVERQSRCSDQPQVAGIGRQSRDTYFEGLRPVEEKLIRVKSKYCARARNTLAGATSNRVKVGESVRWVLRSLNR